MTRDKARLLRNESTGIGMFHKVDFKILTYLFAGAIGLVVVSTMVVALLAVGTVIFQATWPSVPGRVTHVTTREYYIYPCIWTGTGANCGATMEHNPEVEFEYTVEGTHHTASQRFYFSDAGIRTFSLAIHQHYTDGEPVTVYYSPFDPKQAVIERYIPPDIWLDLFLAGLFGFILAAGAVDEWRLRKTKSHKDSHSYEYPHLDSPSVQLPNY